jgi:hypothetical protein
MGLRPLFCEDTVKIDFVQHDGEGVQAAFRAGAGLGILLCTVRCTVIFFFDLLSFSLLVYIRLHHRIDEL